MRRYLIVKSENYEKLTDEVNEYVKAGYVPCGGVAIEQDCSYGDGNEGIGSSSNVYHESIFYQAMFMPEVEK